MTSLRKIVINTCYGGFSISLEAGRRMAELGHAVALEEVAAFDETQRWYGHFLEQRDDPLLVQTVEELGEKANGLCARLKVVEIPSDVEWFIDEYDGMEHVAEKHRTWL